MKATATKLAGVYLLEPTVFGDSRGYFFESYNQNKFKDDQHTIELINFIDKRIVALLKVARFIGRKIYSEESKYFVGRMQNYFEIWRSEYNPLKYSSV